MGKSYDIHYFMTDLHSHHRYNELLKEASNWNGMGQYWLGKQCEILATKLLQGNNETLLNQKIKSEEHFWKTKKFM